MRGIIQGYVLPAALTGQEIVLQILHDLRTHIPDGIQVEILDDVVAEAVYQFCRNAVGSCRHLIIQAAEVKGKDGGIHEKGRMPVQLEIRFARYFLDNQISHVL